MGGVRRIARQSYATTFVSTVDSLPVLTDNWTTQQTTTYDANDPADSPAAWGGTVANLDRVLTATGSTHAALGALLTFVNKPNFMVGGIIKVQVGYTTGSTCAIEVWALAGATWTKVRRVGVAGIVRSGESIILDLTAPILAAQNCDALWITLAPDIGTETLTWTCLHLYGICDDDPETPPCPPATPPEDCSGPECGVDVEDWVCLDPPEEPDPAPPTDPFTLPPILVKVPNPTTYTQSGASWFHNCPRPTQLRMFFGDLPSGGSVTVTVANANGVLFVEGTSQTISAPGEMTWTVLSGFRAANSGADPALPPAQVAATTDFFFTRELDASAFAVAGNLLDILMYFWTSAVAYVEIC